MYLIPSHSRSGQAANAAGGGDRIVGSRVANLITQGANPLSSQREPS